jgi:Mrp family chromosome partitioning ATPase
MSALDQAIIKAYAKDRSASPWAAESVAAAQPITSASGLPDGQAIERLYHDGTLYRIEGARPARAKSEVPAPHLPPLPPTSPRRHVRRSMLKLLAANQLDAAAELPAEPPPRIARKVIIRHVSHAAAPPPLGLLRPTTLPPLDVPVIELPPETIADEPRQTPPDSPIPTTLPPVAPLNTADQLAPRVEICGEWSLNATIPPMVVVAEGLDSLTSLASGIVTVQFDALDLASADASAVEVDPPAEAAVEVDEPAFTAKTLEEQDEPRVEFRYDAPHARTSHRPHARFGSPRPESRSSEPATEAPPTEPSQATAASLTQEELELLLEADAADYLPSPGEDLTFAEAVEEPLASDLIPVEPITEGAPVESKASSATADKKPAALWEVDRFHWPRTCEKLLSDEAGYLSRAGEKLLAAVADGLRVLAITGSRRGEGRTTLALCLARAAAKAGIQTAIMDADFARPQVASKVALEVAYGWQDAATGRVPLSEAAVKSLSDNITVLPLESSAVTRSLSLADPRVTATIRAAKSGFELLILDLGPVAAGQPIEFPPGEACPLDAAIVVRDLRFATTAEGESIGQMLVEAGVEAVGIAENFALEEEGAAHSG